MADSARSAASPLPYVGPGAFEVAEDADRVALNATLTSLEFAMTWRGIDLATPIERVERLAESRGWDDLGMRARRLRASVARRRGQLAEALILAGEVRDWAAARGDDLLAATACNELSQVFRHVGDRAEFMEHAVQALAQTPADAPIWVRVNHEMWMAIALAWNGSLVEGRARFEAAIDLSVGLGDPDLDLCLLNNAAYCISQLGDVARARVYAGIMRELIDENRIEVSAHYLDTLARIALEGGDHEQVELLMAPVLATDDSVIAANAEADGVPYSLLTVAESRRRRGALADAQQVLSRCRDLVDRRGLLELSVQTRREQAALHAAAGAYRDAYAELMRGFDEQERMHDAGREFRAQVAHAKYAFDETRRSRDHFRDLAWRDPLTGLHNRRHLDVELPRLVRAGVTAVRPLSVAILDLDHFKRVNDLMSHEVGDDVLRQAAEIMLDTAPEGAGVVRLGGEEFVILMPNTDHPTALAHCETIRNELAHHDWNLVAQGLEVTASIGVTTSSRTLSSSALLSNADRNLYAAKRGGRNRVVGDTD